MVSEAKHVWSVWIGFLFQTFRDWLESKVDKNSSRWIWDRNNFCVWIQAWTPNEGMYKKSKKSKCFDRIWQTNVLRPKIKIGIWCIIFPYHAFVLPGIGPKARPRFPENIHFREKVYFGKGLVDTTVLAVVTIVVSIRSFCCRSGREQLLWSGSKARR